jgi:DNA ligase (NAD+)
MSKFYIGKLLDNPVNYAKTLSAEELVDLLGMLSDAYYNTGEPLVSDEIYDLLIEILRVRDPKNKYLENVGSQIKGTKEIVELPFEMGSLTKIKPGKEELSKWMNKFKGPYFLSDKEDGVSAQIYKNQSGKIFMYSRGDGVKGQDISHLLKYVVSKKSLDAIPNGTSIRGELIISKKKFKEIEKKMKNARNAVSGLVNAKKFNKDVAKITDFIAYALLTPRLYFEGQIKKIEEWGFKFVKYRKVKKGELTEDLFKEYLIKRRKESDYEMDGIVCVDDSKIYPHTGGYPEHSFAFKMLLDDQIATAIVKEVLWDPSKDGYLKPKIQIKPIDLMGVTVTYITAFNAKYVVDNNIGPGAKVKIVRSGDVIPYILEVKDKAKEPQMPKFPYKWNSTNVDLILKDENDSNGKQIVSIKLLVHFFSTIGVKFMSEGIIKKLVENGYNSVEKILKAQSKKSKMYNIDGLGSKIIDKIYDEIDRAFKEMPLEVFMGASNKLGRGLNAKKLKEVIDMYPNILKETGKDEDKLYDKIIKVPGFSDTLSEQLSNKFKSFKKFYEEIAELKDLSRFEKIKVNKDGIFSGKSIVFTGFRDTELEKFIVDNGGKTSSSVSSNTYILVYADNADTSSNKFVTAKDKGVKMMKKSDFVSQYRPDIIVI